MSDPLVAIIAMLNLESMLRSMKPTPKCVSKNVCLLLANNRYSLGVGPKLVRYAGGEPVGIDTISSVKRRLF